MSELIDKKKLKQGCVIIIIGYQGSGKTPTAKEIASTCEFQNKVVFDVRHEYDENEFTTFHSFETFQEYFLTAKNSCIIFEEATGYIGAFRNLQLTDLLIGVEHNRNTIIFLFHSIKSVPSFMLELSRFIILLETNDPISFVKTDRPLLYPFINEKRPFSIDTRLKVNLP